LPLTAVTGLLHCYAIPAILIIIIITPRLFNATLLHTTARIFYRRFHSLTL